MDSSSRQMPSPSPSVFDQEETRMPNHKAHISRDNMLNIQSLLNPTSSDNFHPYGTTNVGSPPLTPASTETPSSYATSQPSTPLVASAIRQHHQIKDAAAVTHNEIKGTVNYPPHELDEDAVCLSPTQKYELARQHEIFQVVPYSENVNDPIADYTRRIPYSSEKKTFGGKTGRDGFEVFQYFFRVPGDSTKKYAVMWDYNIGLVRITPFFKACGWTKTTPAKALNTNSGLKDLSHSITGGALDAQGYWMPYSCARAMCTTFCYSIRWALTPVFGPSFILDCVRPEDPRFTKFKIDPEIVRAARLEAEAWKTPSMNRPAEEKNIPRSVPEKATIAGGKNLPPRAARPTFKVDSPFSSDSERTRTLPNSAPTSPQVSPKTTYSSPAWTSVNGRDFPSTAASTSYGSLENSLLNKPHHGAWRSATVDDPIARKGKTKTTSLVNTNNTHTTNNRNTNKRQRSVSKNSHPDADYQSSPTAYDAERSESESDDSDIPIHHAPKKRARHLSKVSGVKSSNHATSQDTNASGWSRKYYADDYRAAQWLLNLSVRDAKLAKGPCSSEVKNKKKK